MAYWRLSGFYFFYFAALGALVPYWALYLRSLGFSAVEIGNLMGIMMLSRVAAPNVWGWLADHYGGGMRHARIASLAAVLTYCGVFFGTGFWWLALVMATFTFFWHAALPQLEAHTLTHLGTRYGNVRSWGSVGFIVLVWGLGPVLDRYGIFWLLPTMLAMLIGVWLFTRLIPESPRAPVAADATPFLRVLTHAPVAAFLFASFLMQLSHGPYYTFYTIYLHDHGYSGGTIGALWAFAVVCEIGVFLALGRLLQHIGLMRLLLASCLLASLRWLAIGFGAESGAVLIAAQVLHAATFGVYHAMAIQLVHRFFTGRQQIRGQAIFGSVSGAGAAVGSVYSGWSWQGLGAATTFAIAAAVALAAFASIWIFVRRKI